MMSDTDRWLLVMRHGEAERPAGIDFERCLTEAGRAEVISGARAVMQRGVVPARIMASPLVRAQQTAEILARQLALAEPIATWNELVPEGECAPLVSRLDEVAGIPLLVGHQPLVGRLVEYLSGARVNMTTAAVACLRCEFFATGCCSLEWIWRC